jgi:hypothetical protein
MGRKEIRGIQTMIQDVLVRIQTLNTLPSYSPALEDGVRPRKLTPQQDRVLDEDEPHLPQERRNPCPALMSHLARNQASHSSTQGKRASIR